VSEIGAYFALGGLLEHRVAGFSHRAEQQEMAESVAALLEGGGTLIAEAGTGTGKTFAYLVPALSSGLKVIISTGTRNLQDQLFHRDLPALQRALGVSVSAALLKGRGNYLCRYRLESAEPRSLRRSPEALHWLAEIRRWAGATEQGDIAELRHIPENVAVWPLVTSTADNCLGGECPTYGACHLVEARRRAQEADLVVINHHLLCADFALRDDGFGEILPAADAWVVDEAHQLPETASDFFGVSVSTRQLRELVKDSDTEYRREAGDWPELPEQAMRVELAIRDLHDALGGEPKRRPWRELADVGPRESRLERLREELAELSERLEVMAARGKGLAACAARCKRIEERFDMVCSEDQRGLVRWYETQRQGFRISATPLEVAAPFRQQMERRGFAWLFTSATLSVGGSFEHFRRQLGLDEADSRGWDSPFDFPQQALCFLPPGMPDPRHPRYTERVCELAESLLDASGGRAFLLFTSHRALQTAAAWLAERSPYSLLIQGSLPKTELLERFRALGDAVLLGTSSFWEGVDVAGPALSCVLIDKLPFAAPGDPVLQARIDALAAEGGNPFMEYQVPQAAIALKQGVGRLIRGETDRGVLAICDPRLLTRGYGKVFLDSLPPMRRTRELDEVRRFFGATATTMGEAEA